MTEQRKITQRSITLNPQHKIFADEYLKTHKVSASAIAAGYSKRSAHVSGNRLLKRPDVLQYMAQRVEKQNKSHGDPEELSNKVIQELHDMAFANIADFITVDEAGLPQVDFSTATPEQLKAITSIKTKLSTRYDKDGNQVGTEQEANFGLADKYRGLELLGKHLGLFKADEQRVVVDVADRLLAARRRLTELPSDGEI